MSSNPNGLERLLKGLEGHLVDHVDIERQDGFLHIKMSVIKLNPEYALHETIGGPKALKFTVMWKRTFDRMIDELDKKLAKQLAKVKEVSSELDDVVNDLKEAEG